MMGASTFVRELKSLKDHYRKRDAFVTKWGVNWDNDSIYDQSIYDAWKLYKSRVNAEIPITLLGESALQKDQELLLNFGFTSVSDPEISELEKALSNIEKEVIDSTGLHSLLKKKGVDQRDKMIKGLTDKRTDLSQQALPVTGGGSILGDNRWTTIFNDALILGGVDGHHEFHLALSSQEQLKWEKSLFKRSSRFTNTLSFAEKLTKSPENERWKDIWREFLQENPSMIWQGEQKTNSLGKTTNYDQPRVFARELLGLKLFGYQPFFFSQEILFKRIDYSKPTSFLTYTDNLLKIFYGEALGEHNKVDTLNAISEFLFDDPRVLDIDRNWIKYS